MTTGRRDSARAGGGRSRAGCIWRVSGAVSRQTCNSRPDDCEGCPIYTAMGKLASHRQKHFFSRDFHDQCTVNACTIPGLPCPFSGPCMSNWSRTKPPAMWMLSVMGIGGLSFGSNTSLVQQIVRRFGLPADLTSRLLELRGQGTPGLDQGLDPEHLDLHTTDEMFAMAAAASFLDCLDLLDLSAFAESMLSSALLHHGLPGSISAERTRDEQRNALRAMQGLALLDVIKALDTNVLREIHEIIATTRYDSMAMAHMALTVQRAIKPHTHMRLDLEAGTVERAATLISFYGGPACGMRSGLTASPSEIAAAVIVAHVLGAVPEDGTLHAGRVLVNEMLRAMEAGVLDMVEAQLVLIGIVASGLDPEPWERSAISRAVVRSFQARFQKLGDMRADPISLLASLGADNLVHASDRFDALVSSRLEVEEPDPALLGCEMPFDRFYSRGHQWVYPARGDTVRIGLDDLAAHLIGPIDAVKMPRPGDHLRRGKPALRLVRGNESVAVRSPMEGEVIVVNQSVVDSPGLLPERPYGDGWLVAIHPRINERNISGLMFGGTALEWQRKEARRLRGMFGGRTATAADGATLARDALTGIPGIRWSRTLRKFLKG